MKQTFSAKAFWGKVKRTAMTAGVFVVYTGLLLFYVLQKPNFPKRYKIIIIGALAYFIDPFDVIPDMLPGIGYTDDLTVLGAALIQVAMHVDDEVKQKAKAKLEQWFLHADTARIDKTIEEHSK